MRLRIVEIVPHDERTTAELSLGEVVHHRVDIEVEGEPMSFDVALEAKVLAGFDASVLHGDQALEEMLRFCPAALSAVLTCVGRVRRGRPVELPVEVEADFDGEGRRSAAH